MPYSGSAVRSPQLPEGVERAAKNTARALFRPSPSAFNYTMFAPGIQPAEETGAGDEKTPLEGIQRMSCEKASNHV